MISRWKALQEKYDTDDTEPAVIQKGIDKLEEYYARTDDVPAYVIAMCEYFNCSRLLGSDTFQVLNPYIKLSYYTNNAPEKVASVQALLKQTVCHANSK